MNKALSEIVTGRLITAGGERLWEDGPTFRSLMDALVRGCVEAGDLDSWLPMLDLRMQDVVAYFFQGAAYKLADQLLVHRKIAMIALMFASAGSPVFPGRTPDEILELFKSMPEPDSDNHNLPHSISKLGANLADDWQNGGLSSTFDCSGFKRFIEIITEHEPKKSDAELHAEAAVRAATRLP